MLGGGYGWNDEGVDYSTSARHTCCDGPVVSVTGGHVELHGLRLQGGCGMGGTGGIAISGATVDMVRCVIAGNYGGSSSGGGGGGVTCGSNCIATLVASNVTDNGAGFDGGGGILVKDGGQLLAIDCVIARNYAFVAGYQAFYGHGGASRVIDGKLVLNSSLVEYNWATVAGGGVQTVSGTTLLSDGTLLRSNVAISQPATANVAPTGGSTYYMLPTPQGYYYLSMSRTLELQV